MPPNPEAWNGGDLERMHGGFEQSVRAGWMRPPGSVRDHTWVGPRTPGSNILELAASLDVKTSKDEQGQLQVKVKVHNVGPGHALPTGLPSRAMLLLVKAFCGDQELAPVGGHVVPDFGGFISQRGAKEQWTHWPEAKAGDVIRVVAFAGGWMDYKGPGPFGNGRFAAWQKGMRNLRLVSESTVTSVDSRGKVLLDRPLGKGNIAFLSEKSVLDKHAPQMLAGAPGFAFARVYADKDGNLNVPSFRAVDIVSDNRIRAQESVSTQHIFAAQDCVQPRVHAALLYRSFPPNWVRHWQWTRDDVVMTQVHHRHGVDAAQ